MGPGRGGREIQFDGGGEILAGYLAVPASGHGPGVLVVQESWGLVDHIRDVCDRLGREGFAALAPDLYRGKKESDPEAAGRLMLDLDIPRAIRDLSAAAAELLNTDAVDGPRIGAVGFGMGGQLALAVAAEYRRIAAVVDFYGVHPNVALDFTGFQASVLAVFAENDEFVSPEAVARLAAELESASVRASIRSVPGVRHAFMNDSRPDVFDARAAAEGWDAMLSFLRAEL